MKIITRNLLTLAAAGFATPVFAQNVVREYDLELARQPIAGALNALSVQTGLQITYFGDGTPREIVVGPLHGPYTAAAAISELLSPSGLSFEQPNDRTITVLGSPSKDAPRHLTLMSTSAAAYSFMRVAELSPSGAPADEGSGATARLKNNGKDDERNIEEMIVTAQKREEKLQDVPISISVLTGEQLDGSTDQSVAQALNGVSGVAITSGISGPQISVRGVSASGPIFFGSSPVAYYLDSVPFGFVKSALMPDSSAYDLDRVEVLRGPQGTLYGASALNGVVRVLTKDADLDAFSLKTRTSVSNTRYGGENYRADAAVNVPIIENKLAARAVVGYQDLSGWIDNLVRTDVNDSELLNMRLKVNAQPTDRLSLGLSAWSSRSDQGASAVGNDNRLRRTPIDESLDTDYNSSGFEVGYDFDAVSFTSASSYLDYSRVYAQEGSITLTTPGTGTNVLFTDFDAKVFVQEFNLNSTGEGPWRWSMGGMYRDAEDETWQIRRNLITGSLAGGYAAPLNFTNLSESFALFGELTRVLFDGRLELTGGLRYFEDEVGFVEHSRSTGVPASQLISRSTKFDAVTPRFIVNWHPADAHTVYLSYAEGFRSGADQNPSIIFAAPTLQPVDADTLTNYELGTKSVFLNGRLALDAAVYYIDWQDVQTQLLVEINGTPFAALINGNSASGMGFDMGITASPADGLNMRLGYSVNDLTQDEDVFSLSTLVFRKGERLSYSPKYTLSGSVDYEFPLGKSGYSAMLSASSNFISEQTTRGLGVATVSINNKSHLMTGARFGVISPHNWTATLFADNLNNEQDPLLSVAAGSVQDSLARPQPRTIGLQLDFNF